MRKDEEGKFNEYHQQSISQCRISFWFSIVFAAFGFTIIGISVFTGKSLYLRIIAGTIINTVSVLFFIQTQKTRQMTARYFDKLRHDRRIEESLAVCESISDASLRDTLKLILALHLSGLKDTESIASEIIHKSKTNSSLD